MKTNTSIQLGLRISGTVVLGLIGWSVADLFPYEQLPWPINNQFFAHILLMMAFGVINHPSYPDLYWGSNSRVVMRAALYSGGSGTVIYRLSSMAGNVTVDFAYFGETSPSQITANQNNYALPTGAAFVRMSSDASREITGIVPPSLNGSDRGGQRITIANVGSNNIVFKHQNASSTAANRIIGIAAADVTLAADEVRDLVYDTTTDRWRVVG